MKFNLLLVTAFLLALSNTAAAQADSAELINCHNGYGGGTVITEKNDYYELSKYVTGYVSYVTLAKELGVPNAENFTSVRAKIPTSSCLVNSSESRLSCKAKDVVLVFSGKDAVETVIAKSLEIDTGVVGVASRAFQTIILEVYDGKKTVSDRTSFASSYAGPGEDGKGNWKLCGRPSK